MVLSQGRRQGGDLHSRRPSPEERVAFHGGEPLNAGGMSTRRWTTIPGRVRYVPRVVRRQGGNGSLLLRWVKPSPSICDTICSRRPPFGCASASLRDPYFTRINY